MVSEQPDETTLIALGKPDCLMENRPGSDFSEKFAGTQLVRLTIPQQSLPLGG